MWRQQRKAILKPALGARPLLQQERSTEVGMDIDTPPTNWTQSSLQYQVTAPGPEVEMKDASPVRQQQVPMQHMVNRVVKVSSTRRRKGNNNSRSLLTNNHRSLHDEQEEWEEVQSQNHVDDDDERDEEELHQSDSNSSLQQRRRFISSNAQRALYYGDHHYHHHYAPSANAPAAWDPARASAWFALLVNSSVFTGAASLLGYILYVFTVDVRNKAKQQTRMYQSEITRCTQQYTLNHCGTHNQAPALSTMCAEWEQCYSRDPSSVASNYRLVAEVLADIVQGFLSPLTWKELAAVAVGTYLLVVLIAKCTLVIFGPGKFQTHPKSQADHVPTSYTPSHYLPLQLQQGPAPTFDWPDEQRAPHLSTPRQAPPGSKHLTH